jgi:pyruvate,orthophosphate dikinase
MSQTFVYAFDYKHPKPPMEMKDLLGGKGANVAEMTSVLGLPVPAGFTISTDACRAYMHGGWPTDLDAQVAAAVDSLEGKMGKRIGDKIDPLLVSVRSGAKFSMPGMMDTVLNLGLNDESVIGLAKQTGDDRFALDSYRRFISMFGRIVLGIDGEEFDVRFESAKDLAGVESDADLSVEILDHVVTAFKKIVREHTGQEFPQDPQHQLRLAIEAVFKSWNGERAVAYRNRERIDHELGTAVNVQAMVFGNRDENSGTGVGFTRNPATGENLPYGDFLVNAQGEDVVAGIRKTETLSAMKDHFPKVYDELIDIFGRLEAHYRDMCDTEFTIEQGKLWMLQTRVGKRGGNAALRMAVEMTTDERISLTRQEAVLRVTAEHLDQVLHPQFAEKVTAVTKGLAASPGAAVGKAVFTSKLAAELKEKNERVILVRNETSPDDIAGMLASEGVLTARGGLVSHAAVVARGWGKPAVVGAEQIKIKGTAATIGDDVVINEGDLISINGTTGEVVLGEVALLAAEPTGDFATVLGWADEFRVLRVRANADNHDDAAQARTFGAEGIGLCRTEHMFLGDDRLPVVRRMILAQDPQEEAAALEELRKVQKLDFLGILEAMDGLPVTVRLLDPPLHEFLPHLTGLEIKQATVGLTAEEEQLYEAAKTWEECNPMLGTRGVRLGVLKPGLYEMQVRALIEAALERRQAGGTPRIEVMIPLTVSREELCEARTWVQAAIDEVSLEHGLDITVGTMIETPRAAICADELAECADFFSFGTNDLTQMTFGFSRDDVEGKMMAAYLDKGLLKRSPFETIDRVGVGALVTRAVERGRFANPNIKLGVCGEHGGDPESIQFFAEAGLNYVSCSPFRVPIARLAAAHAALSPQG